MARLPYPDPASLAEKDRALLASLPPLNIFRMLAGAGPIFAPFMNLLDAYLNEGLLDGELRELVILRAGHKCGSAYELHQHERVSRLMGMSAARIAASSAPLPQKVYSDAENAALALTDELVSNVKASKEALDAARRHLSDAQVQELLIVIGIYLLVCRYLETLEIDLEEEEIAVTGLDEIKAGVGALNAQKG